MSTEDVEVVSQSSPEQAVTANSGLAESAKAEEQKSAPAEKSASESLEASEAQEDATDAQAEAGEEDDDADSDESQSKDGKPKKKNGFKKRIAKLNSKITESQRELEYWKAQAMKGQGEPKAEKPQEQQAAKKPGAEGKPDPDNFASYDEYLDAVVDWKSEQREKQKEVDRKADEAKAQEQAKVRAHVDRLEAFKKSHEDFQDLMEEIDDIPMSQYVQEAILDSDNGPELMYELAKHREEYARICKLGPVAAARELGRFEARIAKSSDIKTEIKKTKAPPPIAPVGSKASASVKSLEDMDYDEFKRVRNEQTRRR